MPEAYDVICIGAGPTGLACAIEAKRAGMRPLVIDKGCLCNSLYHYPVNMTFFTTPERMEIGDLPMTIAAGKPTRAEALHYYRRAVEHYGIETRLYETVDKISGHDGAFVVHTHDESGAKHEFHGKKIIIATGYYDRPNPLDIPGENLATCLALFHGRASLLEAECRRHRRKKFSGGSGARFISRRRARHAGSSRRER